MRKMNFERSRQLLPLGVEVGGWLIVVALTGYWGMQLARPLPHLAPRSGALTPVPEERRWETVFSAPVAQIPVQVRGIITSAGGGWRCWPRKELPSAPGRWDRKYCPASIWCE